MKAHKNFAEAQEVRTDQVCNRRGLDASGGCEDSSRSALTLHNNSLRYDQLYGQDKDDVILYICDLTYKKVPDSFVNIG